MKLTKVTVERGRQKYIELQQAGSENMMIDKYVRILQNGFVSVDNAMNIIVIRTVAGMAMAVAAALDALHIDGIVGCIAGDDTIMAAEPRAAYQSVKMGRQEPRRKPLEVVVTELMHEMGIPAHVKGYQYLRDAILRVLADENLTGNITKELYPKVAAKYDTSPDRVERAIRHAIELAWVRGNVDLMTEYFGYTINLQKGKPTNAEFIAMVSDRIRLNY